MFENPLQCLQAVDAVQTTDPDTPLPIAESVEQQVTGYSDLVAHIAGPRQETRCLAARISHTRRQPESDSSSLQGPEAEAGEESLVIGTEQKFEITAMNRGEVRLPDVSRMRQNTLANLVDVLSDQFVRQPEGNYRFGQLTPGWCWCWGHHHSHCPRSCVLRKERTSCKRLARQRTRASRRSMPLMSSQNPQLF